MILDLYNFIWEIFVLFLPISGIHWDQFCVYLSFGDHDPESLGNITG